ncbi:MAG: beta-glucosidase, partial [Clostridia bacterium]|nr:beta-glucosidase [Clostridia bacterium]
SYDDNGTTGNRSCYVLQKGAYKIYAGENVRLAREVLRFELAEHKVVETLQEALAPVENFKRMIAVQQPDGSRTIGWEDVPTRSIDLARRIEEGRMADIPQTEDKGIKLIDVVDGKNSMEEFVAQFTVDDLCCIVCGEGMSSQKVTAGTGGAIGGVTDSLLEKGIPVACVSDGPSGIRMDSGAKAASIPNGMALACSFDEELVEKLHGYLGAEMFAYTIDSLLGPGMNLHRFPLNGRNFEYFSEDPLLSGRTAAAICRGIAQSGCSATIKHFCCNSQEAARHHANSVVSERALREIYLKGYEIAVKEGDARSIMTSYNPTNGSWCASNYDLTTTILRNEWGYKGFVMTDWWANSSCEGEEASKFNLKAMVRAQNDIYMVCPNAAEREHNIREGLAEGYITLGDLQRNAINLLNYIITTPTFFKYVAGGCKKPAFATVGEGEFTQACQFEDVVGKSIEAEFGGEKDCKFDFEMVVNAGDRSQHNITVNIEGGSAITFAVNGTEGNRTTVTKLSGALAGKHIITIDAEPCVKILKLTIWNQK